MSDRKTSESEQKRQDGANASGILDEPELYNDDKGQNKELTKNVIIEKDEFEIQNPRVSTIAIGQVS